MSDWDPRDSEPDRPVCPHCKGRGFIPHSGEPYAADPCGCDEWDPAGDDDTISEEETGLDDAP